MGITVAIAAQCSAGFRPLKGDAGAPNMDYETGFLGLCAGTRVPGGIFVVENAIALS